MHTPTPFAVCVIDDSMLQDGPRNAWPADHVASIVDGYMRSHGLRCVITFDAGGVTGHANHAATHAGVARFLARGGGDVLGLELRSTGVARRLLGALEVAPTMLGCACTNAARRASAWVRRRAALAPRPRNSWGARLLRARRCCVNVRPWVALAAMLSHRSQLVWYRALYMLASRYVFVNTLVEMETGSERGGREE